MSSENLSKRLKDDLIRTLMEVEEEAGRPRKEPVDTGKMEQLVKNLVRIVKQAGDVITEEGT